VWGGDVGRCCRGAPLCRPPPCNARRCGRSTRSCCRGLLRWRCGPRRRRGPAAARGRGAGPAASSPGAAGSEVCGCGCVLWGCVSVGELSVVGCELGGSLLGGVGGRCLARALVWQVIAVLPVQRRMIVHCWCPDARQGAREGAVQERSGRAGLCSCKRAGREMAYVVVWFVCLDPILKLEAGHLGIMLGAWRRRPMAAAASDMIAAICDCNSIRAAPGLAGNRPTAVRGCSNDHF
jgi:hypothetical protein